VCTDAIIVDFGLRFAARFRARVRLFVANIRPVYLFGCHWASRLHGRSARGSDAEIVTRARLDEERVVDEEAGGGSYWPSTVFALILALTTLCGAWRNHLEFCFRLIHLPRYI